jgi:hypothetical protein
MQATPGSVWRNTDNSFSRRNVDNADWPGNSSMIIEV